MVQPGTLLEGKYEILAKIREGGMGAIYRVRHRLLEEIRVVKVMKPSVVADEDLRRRFIEEARTATRLKHPHICTIHDFAIDESGMAYLVMEYIDGASVADLLKLQGKPPLPLALEIAHQALLALGFLHRKGIVHRDVAPDNIMLTRDEQGAPVVKLIDLGIAKVTEAPVEATATGVFLGKLKYASPEQYGSLPKGQKLDGRSDLYGLGIVLYEMLTGVLPFEGDTVVELLRAHVFSPPKPFSQSDPEGRVPKELREAVLKSLQKRRDDRFENAEAFDRSIMDIRARHQKPGDSEVIRSTLARVRPSREVRVVPPTPSAQNHIDQHFFAETSTPTPSWRTGENDKTAVAPPPGTPSPIGAIRQSLPTLPLGERVRRGVRLWAIAAAAGLLVLAGILWVASRRKGETSVASSSQGVAPTQAEHRPTDAPPATAAPTFAPAAVSEPTVEPRNEEPTPAPRPTVAHREPTPRHERPTRVALAAPVPAIPPSPAAVPAPEPTRTAVAIAAAEPLRVTLPAALVATAKPAPSESDRIRETVRLYETAQTKLDPDLYARVFPGVDRSRIEQAFSSFRSQAVQFEIRKIELGPQGTTAQVSGFETRVAVPKAGNDLRVTADRVLELAKRGDAWVITAIH